MASNVNISRTNNENTQEICFAASQKLFRGTGITPEVKGRRYYTRELSTYKTKKRALRKIELAAYYDEQRKQGVKNRLVQT